MSTEGSCSKKTIGFVYLIILYCIQKTEKCGFFEETQEHIITTVYKTKTMKK